VARFPSKLITCPCCGDDYPETHYRLRESGNRSGKCRKCKAEENRARYRRVKERDPYEVALERAIKHAKIPERERFSEDIPARYENGFSTKVDDALILGEHTTAHGVTMWWLAILTIKSSPFVAPVDKLRVKDIEWPEPVEQVERTAA